MAIYIHDEADRLRLRVTGDLDDFATEELASCWKTASSVVGQRPLVVDLTGLYTAQASGRNLLETLHRQGVQFLTASEFQAELVAGVTGKPTYADAHDGGVGRWLKHVFGMARA